MSNAKTTAPKSTTVKFAAVTVITDAAKLAESVDSVARKGKSLDTLIHKTGVSCMYHAQQHGDVTLLEKLVEAMPKSSRRKALITWAEDNMPLDGKVVDGKNGVSITLKKGRTDADFTLTEAAATPFWEHTKEKDPRPMTLKQAIAAFGKNLDKAVKAGTASAAEAAALKAAVAGSANDEPQKEESKAA